MDRFLRTLSIRRKKRPKIPESNGGSHPISWQEDERKVREGTCSFQVKYLGSVEVFESRGIQICEDAIKRLKSQSKHKRQRAILYVSGDALRVVDELSKGLLVDQTIEKVSFCAPDRYHSKGFAYICRDGTTRRWLCHGFLAVKESGERLSHAVGCAFAICLEKKQKREREAVTVQFNEDRTSFTRFGSFRQVSLAERLQDPQAVKPVPSASTADTSAANTTTTTSTEATAATSNITAPVNTTASSAANGSEKPLPTTAIQRPHASVDLLERQASFRGFPKLHELVSPFKRHVSLRLTELPSTRERRAHDFDVSSDAAAHNGQSTDSQHAKSHSSHSNHKRDDASIGLSNSAFAAAPQPAPPVPPPQPQTVPNGVNPNASLWQTPTIVEEEEPALEPAVAPSDDPFAAAPFSSKPHVTQLTSSVAATMHHSLTSGSIASAATPTASASPSVASGLSTPARPLGGFSLLSSSTSMTPVASPQPPVGVPLSIQPTLGGVAPVSGSLMMTPIGGGMYAASNVVVMPSGNVVVSPFGMVGPVNPATIASGGTLVMAPGNSMMPLSLSNHTPMTPPPQNTLNAAQFAESSVPPSANRAQFAASGGPTSPTTGSNVDPFDVAWAEKQTTRARLNNPFANANLQAQTSNADSSSNANRPVVETFNVRL